MNRVPVDLPPTIKHGTQAAYLRCRCRCTACSQAHTRYLKAYKWDQHRGIARTVPAEKVREHVAKLHAAGMTNGHIAACAGLKSHRVVWTVIQPGRVYVQRRIADAILSVIPGALPNNLDDQAETFVSGEGARRRIRALLAMGWTHAHMLEHSGVQTHVMLSNSSPRITWRNHRRIADMYDDLSMTPGPSHRTRLRAAALGYAPPLAWDDIALDDTELVEHMPSDLPCQDFIDEVAIERFIDGTIAWNSLTRKERTEAALRMDRRGYSRNEIAERTHLNSATLWAAFKAAAASERNETIAS